MEPDSDEEFVDARETQPVALALETSLTEDFQDAYESQTVPCTMDLETSLEEAKKAIRYFFNNEFDEVRKILEPHAQSSLYHALGKGVFAFVDAVLTFDQQHIQAASEELKNSTTVCNRFRRNNTISKSLSKMVKKVNYDSYTSQEIHAELCYAELLLLKTVLTLIEDETLASFIKAGFKLRSCYSSYKLCNSILHSRHWKKESHEIHFEGGVRMGIGGYNLMISFLPARVIKVLEFIGFSGSKEIGLRDLKISCGLDNLRQELCAIILLDYNLVIVYTMTHLDGDLKFCDEILTYQMQLYPKAAVFLFFKGRLEFVRGNIDDSIKWFTDSWNSQNAWPHLHHICFWELVWNYSAKQDWREASIFADMLLHQSRWSRTIYSYLKAAMLSMLGDSLSNEEKCEIEALMKDAPQLKQRIAGKSIPMEKFMIKKSERFFAQKQMLVLPAIELQYLWNYFKIFAKKSELIEGVFKLIEKAKIELEAQKEVQEFDADNRALILLLKGAALRHMKDPLHAEECLNAVLALEKQIRDDKYLVPYAKVELACIQWGQGNLTKSAQLLEEAKKNNTGYALESRLHFTIHSLEVEIKEGKRENSSHNSLPSPSTSK